MLTNAQRAELVCTALGLEFKDGCNINEWNLHVIEELTARVIVLKNQQEILLQAIEVLTASEMRRINELNNGGLITNVSAR